MSILKKSSRDSRSATAFQCNDHGEKLSAKEKGAAVHVNKFAQFVSCFMILKFNLHLI